jgi:hypothetical protein
MYYLIKKNKLNPNLSNKSKKLKIKLIFKFDEKFNLILFKKKKYFNYYIFNIDCC